MGKLIKFLAIILLLGFFLPYATVSCSGEDVATMTAGELAIGADAHDLEYPEDIYENDPIVELLLVIVLAIFGFFVTISTDFEYHKGKMNVIIVIYGTISALTLYIPTVLEKYLFGRDELAGAAFDLVTEFGYTFTLVVPILIASLTFIQVMINAGKSPSTNMATYESKYSGSGSTSVDKRNYSPKSTKTNQNENVQGFNGMTISPMGTIIRKPESVKEASVKNTTLKKDGRFDNVIYNSTVGLRVLGVIVSGERNDRYIQLELKPYSEEVAFIRCVIKLIDVFEVEYDLGTHTFEFSSSGMTVISNKAEISLETQLDLKYVKYAKINITGIVSRDREPKKIEVSEDVGLPYNELLEYRQKYGRDVFTKKVIGEHNWTCMCGTVNYLEDPVCNLCERKKDILEDVNVSSDLLDIIEQQKTLLDLKKVLEDGLPTSGEIELFDFCIKRITDDLEVKRMYGLTPEREAELIDKYIMMIRKRMIQST